MAANRAESGDSCDNERKLATVVKRGPVRPWTQQELTELATLPPRDGKAMLRFAQKHGRGRHAVRQKLTQLQVRGLAADVEMRRVDASLLSQGGLLTEP
jgi:hypothetical protein